MKTRLLLATLFLICLSNASLAQIPLIVEERAGISREREPVTLGVPLARGSLMEGAPVRITDPAGSPVDAQFRTMATWDDGSIRWLKCDYQPSVGSNDAAEYRLELNASHTPSTELAVNETGSEITVTTGPLRFVVSKTDFNLFDRAWLDLNGDRQYTPDEEIISSGASTGPVVTMGGTDYLASSQAPEQIEIEEEGPLKVVIKISGRHYNAGSYLLKYETRIYAYAGQSFVRVRHVYANGQSIQSMDQAADPSFGAAFDRYGLDLQLNLTGSKTVRFGGDGGDEYAVGISSSEETHLIQVDRTSVSAPLAYEIRRGSGVLSSGSRAEGWGDISDGRWGLLVSSRYFWQKYPKGVLFGGDGLVSFEPAPTPEFLWAGMGTGDDILLYFHPASESDQARQFAMGHSKEPLFARTSTYQYASSQAFYPLISGQSSLYPGLNNYIDGVTSNHLSNRENLQLYGNINFGDVPRDEFEVADFRDESTWGNNYYDCVLTTTRLFAQTADPRLVEIFIPMAWHFMETDCWNTYDPNDWLNGFCAPYGAYHRAATHFEQHYGEGIWYYYYMTGDERAKEVGLRAARSIVQQQAWANENVDCRMAYQRGSACLEAWKATGDPTYLDHAEYLLVDKILATQDTFGLIGGSFEEGGYQVQPEQTFMMALYSDALWKFIKEMSVQDPARQQLVDRLVLLADLFDLYARKAPGVEDYWNFWPLPSNSQPPQPIEDPGNPDATVYWNGRCLMAGTYAYAYDLISDNRYRDLARDLIVDTWSSGEEFGWEFWGKASSQAMKNMIHAVAIVEGGPVGIGDSVGKSSSLPRAYRLAQNYPNPFNPSTTIEFQLSEDARGRTSLRIYDIRGRQIRSLVDDALSPGSYTVHWDGRDDRGAAVPSGVFFYRLCSGDYSETRKLVVMK